MAQIVHQPTDLNGPAYYPPLGVEPRLDRQSDGNIYSYTLLPALGVLATIFMGLRIYTKARIVRRLNVPDFLLLLSYPLFITTLVVGRLVIKYGAGSHQWNVLLRDYITMYYWINTAEALWNVSTCLIKVAIVLQYLEMLAPNKTVNPRMWWSSWILIFVLVGFYTSGLFSVLFICTPRTSIWNVLQKGKCRNEARLVLITALFNILTDVIMLLLPVRSVWKMRIERRKKSAIVLLFCTGLSACAAALVRIYYMVILALEGDDPDLTYHIIWVGVWSCVEIVLGMMIACSLVLPKFFRHHNIHFSSFLSRFSHPSRTFKFSFIRSHDSSESNTSEANRKKASKKKDRKFNLTFHQGRDFGSTFRASRIMGEDQEERDVELGAMRDKGKGRAEVEESALPSGEASHNGIARVEHTNGSEARIRPDDWMDAHFETGGHFLEPSTTKTSATNSTTNLAR